MRLGINSGGKARCRARAYLLTEALVYVGAVVVLLGVGYVAMHRAIDSSLVLRRDADLITRAAHAGELWRRDIRNATQAASAETGVDEQVLHLQGATGTVDYLFTQGALYRRVSTGPWSKVLDKVKASSMQGEVRSGVNAWLWNLELSPEVRGSVRAAGVRPLFSFLAVAPCKPSP